ncbi:hypothetical protein [Streptomyces sp. bgisy027]|uniref:hypothetical protein n=1 Tax=unclassified Streptomyces TaxID=2593676 RepID=UPI003D74F851
MTLFERSKQVLNGAQPSLAQGTCADPAVVPAEGALVLVKGQVTVFTSDVDDLEKLLPDTIVVKKV